MHWLSKKSTKIIMIMPAVILFTVFFLAPIFISVYYSFTDFSGIGAAKFIGFKNYQVLLKDKFFFIALKNTFIILIGITITILPLSFIVALLLVFRFGKLNKIFYFAGALFFVMGAWWLVGAILQQDLFAGALGWAFRGVMAVALVLLCMAYYRERKKDNSEG